MYFKTILSNEMLPKCHSNCSLAKFSLELGFQSSTFTPKWRWPNHSNPHYSSCTFKATTPLSRALFHSPPLSFRNHHHQNQRRAHRNAIIWYLELWFFLQVVHLSSKLSCCFCVLLWFECLFIHFNQWVFVQIVLEHLFSILCRILDIFVLLFFIF